MSDTKTAKLESLLDQLGHGPLTVISKVNIGGEWYTIPVTCRKFTKVEEVPMFKEVCIKFAPYDGSGYDVIAPLRSVLAVHMEVTEP